MPHIPRIFCGQCGVDMTITHTGKSIEVCMQDGHPYYKIQTDEYSCVRCGAIAIYVSPMTEVMTEHYQPNYDRFNVDQVVRLGS